MAATKNESCPWEGMMPAIAIQSMSEINYNTGIIIMVAGLLLSTTMLATCELFKIGSYRTLTNYIATTAIRRSVPGLVYLLPYVQVIYSWQDFSVFSCDFYGFWETIFAVFELESYTMVCVERYVNSKYVSKGWKIPPYHYYLYTALSCIFSFMYAFPPLVGIGKYVKDVNCHHCTFDMMLPEVAWKRIMVVTIFFMRSIKPAIMMLVMIYWARRLEPHIKNNERNQNLTRGVRAALCVILLCGLPLTLVRGQVVLSQLIYEEMVVPHAYIFGLVMSIHWLAPLPAMLMLLKYDTFLRDKTIRFLRFESLEEVVPTVTQEVITEEADNNDNGNNDKDKKD